MTVTINRMDTHQIPGKSARLLRSYYGSGSVMALDEPVKTSLASSTVANSRFALCRACFAVTSSLARIHCAYLP